MKRLFAFATFSIILFSSCNHFRNNHIRGNGNVVSQTRNISHFSSVEVSNAIDLYIKQDSAYSVKVEIDEDLQNFIIVSEENGKLWIRQERNTSLDATGKIKVYISAPAFKYIGASGACNVIGENMLTASEKIEIHVSGASDAKLELKAPRISADLTGASGIRLKGETKDFSIEGSGASHANCFELMTENADIDVSGASEAEVFASVKLEAEASGASHVKYKGAANYVGHTSGAGSITKAD